MISTELIKTFRKRRMALIFLGAFLVLLWTYTQSMIHAVTPWPPMAIMLPLYVIGVGLLQIVKPKRRVLLLFFLCFVLSRYPWQLTFNPLFGNPGHLQIDLINDAAIHRDHTHYAWDRRTALNRARHPIHSFSDYDGILVTGICGELYMQAGRWGINYYGLTDAILAHAVVPSERPGHKAGLQPLAFDLQEIYLMFPPGPGVFRKAAESGRAPKWITDNLDGLYRIEQQIFNEHDFWANLKIAMSPSPRIYPPRKDVRLVEASKVQG